MSELDLEARLKSAEGWPSVVKGWSVESGLDAQGHDAYWVWVTLDDPLHDRSLRNDVRRRVRQTVNGLVQPDPSWVYVRFLGAAEAERS